MKRFYIISTLILCITIAGCQLKNRQYIRQDADSSPASIMFEDTTSFDQTEQQAKQLAIQGEKAYKQIRAYIEKKEYRKALDIFETNMGSIDLYLGHSNYTYPFHEEMIELYYKVLDEEEAREKAINIRQFNHAIMRYSVVSEKIPIYYFRNASQLSNTYCEKKDYNQAADIAESIISVYEQIGDTCTTGYAVALSNLGAIYWEVLCGVTDSLGINKLENESDEMADILREAAMPAIDMLRKANAIYNSISEMRYSEANLATLMLISKYYSIIQETPDLQTLEQIRAIYEKND